jgi:hypothetical protein
MTETTKLPLCGSASVQFCGGVAEVVLSSVYFQWWAISVVEINMRRVYLGGHPRSRADHQPVPFNIKSLDATIWGIIVDKVMSSEVLISTTKS